MEMVNIEKPSNRQYNHIFIWLYSEMTHVHIIGGIMVNGIRQQAIVGKGRRIEVLSPELPIGARVEIIILIEPSSPRFLKRASHKEWLKSVKPVNVSFPITEEWLEQAKCEGRD
jgi:hypothetical protein